MTCSDLLLMTLRTVNATIFLWIGISMFGVMFVHRQQPFEISEATLELERQIKKSSKDGFDEPIDPEKNDETTS